MNTSIVPAPAGKRGRYSSVILTNHLCEKRVAKRLKLYDRKCPGLYVSITTAGVATFSFKFTDRQTGKQRTGWLGIYNPETFTVEDARSKVYGLKAMGGEALAETFRDQKAAKAKRGKTVSDIIDERITWMKTLVKKPDGEMRPRLESWENTASHLDRLIRPRLGKKLAMEVTKHDIATLSNDIVAGKFGKPSVSNARHMRKAASGLFNWAAEAGRDYVTASPCVNLPKLDPEHPRTRVLSEDEIRTFWHGLDRNDLPYDRKTRLALKFELVTMLRSRELLGAHREELFDLEGHHPRFDVPLKRVKKRRVIQQPLSDLAVKIIKEALASDDQQFVFESPMYKGQPIHRKAMADALRGTKHEKNKDKTKTAGLCELLGLRPFTPHDLRRTAATLAGDLGFDDAAIAKCLDHAVSKKGDVIVPTVTGKVYNHSKRMKEKRAVLDGVAAELRRIIGKSADAGLRLVA
ncbi:tyrosine-type recombinase/integrase [Bradyrhizobium japonicum]|uniref:tyrosine-type recombinase/integrase n=2 Tax=Bradyrhizobium japonicum TaxID=375 RepID=UPI00057E2B9F|nr:site-specific integrase [Bradyrhizobium japonicum]MCD9110168.1 site-specific integrase [Bradyrhizobium japonicum]MCD9258415.1 site-specific integrase [Bradyrhizobium japonicum SEMIA 5079]MCD9823408.1 site-specific integrase [Bradyrhizobium japonicum]MCD9895009.1 site-specific integrase [Bradyrhizobium japonicum]MCD9910617.1 site-specific integrase [Bradyrhizobium japonicum]